ncbi:MAG: VOC family protein [Dehalococcoidia bacterium]
MPPPGYRTITPRIFVDQPQALVAFLQHVFGARVDSEPGRPVEVVIGDSRLIVSDTTARGPHPAFLYICVDDVDATYERANPRAPLPSKIRDPRLTPTAAPR